MIHIASPNSNSFIEQYEKEDIQPNALDVRLDKVFKIEGIFRLDNENKTHRKFVELFPLNDPRSVNHGYFVLGPGYYSVTMESKITIGQNESGYIIPRSTLVRNGIILITGLYDSGYSGIMASGLHVTTDYFIVKPGTRIGQFILTNSESIKSYDGDYGTGSVMDKTLYGVS